MSKNLLASIIISSYNYGRFLAEAIDSALNQTYTDTEVIVVDDGSTDNSPEIIASYNNRIIPVLKENGGQASAWNAGFRVIAGQVIFFLDSDDVLLPTAVEKAMELFRDPNVAKVHWSVLGINKYGEKTDKVTPQQPLPEGDLREGIIFSGPGIYLSPPTSGNAWARSFLDKVLPMPESEYVTCPDMYLFSLAPAFGLVKKISAPQSYWRIHGENNSWRESFEETLKVSLRRWEHCFSALSEHFRDMGVYVDIDVWKANSWYHRLHLSLQDITTLIPPGKIFILVDEDQLGFSETISSLRRLPFLERDGQYWGAPPNDQIAIRELERMRQSGASFIVLAWTAFWWLDYYVEFIHYLRSNFPCVLENERLIVFNLKDQTLTPFV